MFLRQRFILFLIIFNFIFSIESFPPKNILPTNSNADNLNLIKYFSNEQFGEERSAVNSEFRSLYQSREEISKSDAAHLLRRTTFGPTLEDIQFATDITPLLRYSSTQIMIRKIAKSIQIDLKRCDFDEYCIVESKIQSIINGEKEYLSYLRIKIILMNKGIYSFLKKLRI